MADYITMPEFKARHGITTDEQNGRIPGHIAAGCREVDTYCGRTFTQHVGAASVRYFPITDDCYVDVDDCYDISAVATDDADNGGYATTWTIDTDYLTEPTNGVGVDGQTGWPVTRLRAVGSKLFPIGNKRPALKVTAKWGWEATPPDVIEACHLMTHRLYYEAKVPGGITAPNVDFGLPGQTLAPQYTANRLLAPYRRSGKTSLLVA